VEALATRPAGLARLAAFVPRAGAPYARTRNHDTGPQRRDNVSGLSPWIRLRLLTEREVLAAAVETHGPNACRKFAEEVCWRTYFKGWLELRPAVWADYRTELERLRDELSGPGARRDAWRQALAGETGIDCFDAWVRELAETGYLHNHARMWFASIWIFTLGLPWQLGADLFLRQLLDGDPASNTLSWRWVAGLHTRGKTYLARRDNIRKYSGGRFDPGDRLSRAAPAVDEPPPPPAAALTPRPPLPAGRPLALLLTEDDLHPESLGLPAARVAAVGGFSAAAERAVDGTADGPVAFARGGLEDALARAAQHFEAGTRLFEPTALEDIGAWLEGAGLTDLAVPWPPVGPARARAADLAHGLVERGVDVWPLRRDWDDRLWPLATGGYFGFRKRGLPVALTMAAPADGAADDAQRSA
jgi:deoxyribodipyrimidine photo-lyase